MLYFYLNKVPESRLNDGLYVFYGDYSLIQTCPPRLKATAAATTTTTTYYYYYYYYYYCCCRCTTTTLTAIIVTTTTTTTTTTINDSNSDLLGCLYCKCIKIWFG